jgi:hypothetical protein
MAVTAELVNLVLPSSSRKFGEVAVRQAHCIAFPLKQQLNRGQARPGLIVHCMAAVHNHDPALSLGNGKRECDSEVEKENLHFVAKKKRRERFHCW